MNAVLSNSYFEVVTFLYVYGADIDIHTSNKDQITPIYAALLNSHLEIVKFLYVYGADVDIHVSDNN